MRWNFAERERGVPPSRKFRPCSSNDRLLDRPTSLLLRDLYAESLGGQLSPPHVPFTSESVSGVESS